MRHDPIIQTLEREQLKKDVPAFNVGDTLRVHTRIIEGKKERMQAITGTVIAKKGRGLSETFTIYRVSHGSGMERLFLVHSPKVAKIEVTRKGEVRRAKLYYLRGKAGKQVKVKEHIAKKGVPDDTAQEAGE